MVTFALAAAAAASVVGWGLRLGADSKAEPLVTQVAANPLPNVAADLVAKALGATASPAPAPAVAVAESTRFALLGVVASGTSVGAALLSVDGQPAKSVRVGATVADSWMLHSVRGRQAFLAPLGTSAQAPQPAGAMVLDMPPLAPSLLPVR